MKNYSKNKEINKLIAQKVSEGWIIKFSKHIKLIHPEGGYVSISLSPSCPFAAEKVKKDINRIGKSHLQTTKESA